MKKSKICNRKYILTSEELKALLGLTGEITEITLNSGLCPADEENGVSRDREEWEIATEEIMGE